MFGLTYRNIIHPRNYMDPAPVVSNEKLKWSVVVMMNTPSGSVDLVDLSFGSTFINFNAITAYETKDITF
jgi:hypothetical protein